MSNPFTPDSAKSKIRHWVKFKTKQHYSKVQLNSFPINGLTLGFCPWNQKLENFVFTLGVKRVRDVLNIFLARLHYERNLKQYTLQVWQDIWWAGRRGWKLNIRADYHNRFTSFPGFLELYLGTSWKAMPRIKMFLFPCACILCLQLYSKRNFFWRPVVEKKGRQMQHFGLFPSLSC